MIARKIPFEFDDFQKLIFSKGIQIEIFLET